MKSYNMPENLMQDIVVLIGSMPARQVRGVLNAIESVCSQQDSESEEKAADKKRSAILDELKAAGWTPPAPAAEVQP